MSTRGWWLVLLSAGLQVAANLLLRAGLRLSGGLGNNWTAILEGLTRLVRQPLFDLGVILYGCAAIVWLQVISSEPLSVAYPLLVSISFILVSAGAVILFQEPVTWAKIVGIAVIVIGIIILGRA